MMSIGSIGNIFGIIGHVFSIVLFLLPLPTIKTICKKKTVEQNLPIMYLATLMNCMIWFLYGMPFVQPNRVLVLTINGFGIFIEAVYIVIFLVFAQRCQRAKIIGILMAELLFVGIVLAAVLGGADTHNKRTNIVGPLCVFFGSVMYAPVISKMRMVIQKKSVEYMSFDFHEVVSFFNVICWLDYSILHMDFYMMIPYLVGALLIVVLVFIDDWYLRNGPQDEPQQNLELPEVTPSIAPDTLSSVQVEK